MVGDDTSALQSVLMADVWREHLLKEERELNAKMNDLDITSDSTTQASTEEGSIPSSSTSDSEKTRLAEKLRDIYSKLEDIESDKAEAR